MKGNDLFLLCLSYFKEYEEGYNEAIINSEKNTLILRRPSQSEEDYLFYEINREIGRESGVIRDLADFLELTEEFSKMYKPEMKSEILEEENSIYDCSNYGFLLERKK